MSEKSKDTPAEFPSDWHYEAELDALARNIAGLEHRLLELRGMASASPEQLAAAENDIEVARAKLESYGVGQKRASKRPANGQKKTRA